MVAGGGESEVLNGGALAAAAAAAAAVQTMNQRATKRAAFFDVEGEAKVRDGADAVSSVQPATNEV